MPEEKKVRIGASLDADVSRFVNKLADAKNRSFSYMVNYLLSEAKNKRKDAKTTA